LLRASALYAAQTSTLKSTLLSLKYQLLSAAELKPPAESKYPFEKDSKILAGGGFGGIILGSLDQAGPGVGLNPKKRHKACALWRLLFDKSPGNRG